MTRKLLSVAAKGLEGLTSVRFVLGFLTGCGVVAAILADAVGLF